MPKLALIYKWAKQASLQITASLLCTHKRTQTENTQYTHTIIQKDKHKSEWTQRIQNGTAI